MIEPPSGCPREFCYAPATGCLLGYDADACEFFGAPPAAAGWRPADGRSLPWSGLALGSADFAQVACVGRPHIVALVGAAGAGKTTALAATMLSLRRGGRLGGGGFAGSYTLTGWHLITRALQWVPHGGGGFPAHTSASDARSPALLHLALADRSGAIRDVCYPDVPGEWFQAWAYDAADAPGARWVAEAADGFIVCADSEALAGPDRGTARAGYDALANRLAAVAAGRPVVPVLTKADIALAPPVRAHVDDRNRRLFGRGTVPISIRDITWPVTRPLDEVTGRLLAGEPHTPPEPPIDATVPMLAYRSAHWPGARDGSAHDE